MVKNLGRRSVNGLVSEEKTHPIAMKWLASYELGVNAQKRRTDGVSKYFVIFKMK